MNKTRSDTKDIYKKIIDVGDYLKGKLPPSARHPKGRNSHAHVFQMIKKKFGKSYKEVKDIDQLLIYLEWIKENPC